MDYYSRPEVSNSTLTALKRYFMPSGQWVDLLAAYRFGTLVDCFLTETEKINYNTRRIGDYLYNPEEFETAQEMKNKFLCDPLCRSIYDSSKTQVITVKRFAITYEGHTFIIEVRMKTDFEQPLLITDYKTTACTTQHQFEQSIRYFGYDRQAAWYMDIKDQNNFLFIGQCKKKPYNIFKVPVQRGDAFYRSGREEYEFLAFRHWCLF